MADLVKQLSEELLNLFSNNKNELPKFVSKIKTENHDILPEVLRDFSNLLSNQTKLDRAATLTKLKKLVLSSKSENDLIKAIELDINKNFAHLPESERKEMIDKQTAKFKAEKQKKKRKQQNKKANKEKSPEELLANFAASLEKQLAHKTPEEKKIKMDEELKKYKEVIDRRGKTIDELVEDEKKDISEKINEFLNKKYPDKTEEEKAKMFKEHFDKNVKLCKEGFEDTKVFNKRMEEKRRELEEIKYADDVEGLNKMRKQLVEICIKQKKDFLGILDEDNNKANDPNIRMFEPGKEPIVKSIPVEAPNDDFEMVEQAASSNEDESSAQLVEIEPNEIMPVVSEKEKRIRAKYTPNNEHTANLVEFAIRDSDYFEHDRTEYVYYDRLNENNFTDKSYYYKANKFYIDNPERKKPYINLLYWSDLIDAVELKEDDYKSVDNLIEQEKAHQAKLREKQKQEHDRIAAEKKEIKDIDRQLETAEGDLKASLIERRNLLEPPEKTPAEQLQDYALEMREKYSRIENVRVERQGIINMELSEYTKTLKREIAKERKLTNERKEKTDELTEMYKKQHQKANHIKNEVDEYIKLREKELDTYFIPHGVDPKEHDDVAINNSKIIFADYLKQKDTTVWKSMEPEMKQEYFKAKYPQFFDSFPIVIKFMIQQDKYEVTAFKRFLEKCRTNVAAGANPYSQNMPKKGTKRLTPNEEKWLENQAFYVQYLVEDYRKRVGKRITTSEANWIRNKQLEALRSEMMDFRSNFERVAEKLKADHNNNDEQLLKEYINQIKEGNAVLTVEEQENIAFAIEQIVKRKEDIKAKMREVEKASQKELVDAEDDTTLEFSTEIEDSQDPSASSQVTVTKPNPDPKPKPQKTKDLKKRLLALRKKHIKLGSAMPENELKEYTELKLMLLTEPKVKPLEKINHLDETLGCHCLKHTCEKCTVSLTNDEKNKFESIKLSIRGRDPKTWNIWESFIMKSPNKSTVLLEYAGGYIEPVSVRQFLQNNKFSINGDCLEVINKNKKYGGFFPVNSKTVDRKVLS